MCGPIAPRQPRRLTKAQGKAHEGMAKLDATLMRDEILDAEEKIDALNLQAFAFARSMRIRARSRCRCGGQSLVPCAAAQ